MVGEFLRDWDWAFTLPHQQPDKFRSYMMHLDKLFRWTVRQASADPDIERAMLTPIPLFYERLERFIERVIIDEADEDDAVSEFYHLLPDAVRGRMVLSACRCHIGHVNVRRRLFVRAWRGGHDVGLLRACGLSLPEAVGRFKYFGREALTDPIDQALLAANETLTVFRGARLVGGSIKKAAAGLSWTLDADEAGRFARKRNRSGEGVVLRATIHRDHVLALWHLTEEKREPEIVVDWRRLRDVEVFWRIAGINDRSLDETDFSVLRAARHLPYIHEPAVV